MGRRWLDPLLLAYRVLFTLLTPLLLVLLLLRAWRGQEDPRRLPERLGWASQPRPPGPLVWLHAASVGELISLQPLVRALLEPGAWARRPSRTPPNLLVTSVTRTAAELAPQVLPAGVLHQMAPIDHWLALALFRHHWRPSLGLLAEAELWPELVHAMPQLLLINARISARSHRRHRRIAWFGRWLYGQAMACFPQSHEDAERLLQLGAPPARAIGSTKWDAKPLPVNPVWVERLRLGWTGRRVLLLASSHPGEEQGWLDAWAGLCRQLAPQPLALLLAPRHPERAPEVLAAAAAAGLVAQSLAAFAPGPSPEGMVPDVAVPDGAVPDVVVVDRLGLMGSWIAVADLVVIGGSFRPAGRVIGGHNPLEPVQGGRPVLCGPDMANFSGLCEQLEQAGWLWRCRDAAEAWERAARLLAQPPRLGQPPVLQGPSQAIARLVLETLS